ncbi:MAG: transketolase C-terminal domain-containing protein, partial [Steroidobacteraceae bacterium]
LYTASTLSQPTAVRYPRGVGPGVPVHGPLQALPIGKAEVRRNGHHGAAILAFGSMVAAGEHIADEHDMTLVNMRFVKPLDEKTILAVARKHRAIVTLEENVVAGGAGSAVAESLAAAGLTLPILHLGLPDRFIEHGSREDCLAAAGLDTPTLEARILRWWREHHGANVQLSA